MSERRRAAAVIVRDGRVLMVHERSRRSGGGEWWTLPGGGLHPGETAEEALRREVFEETGLVVSEARYVLEMPYPSGMTSVFAVTVADGEPRAGQDDGFGPEPLGVDWLPVPELPIETNGVPVPPLMVVLPTLADGHADGVESVTDGVVTDKLATDGSAAGAGSGSTGVATERRRSTTK
ncbi:NUDIX hydrolase [Actinoplanes sp. NEAU-A11]|uniref:NUDIX hydrolase n=1 Tax=Actinoplanes aureus TaxID=2792083 RepID=A0A931C4Z5_9ACTN|nr:NUDIX hydrolase [Actinoplanes aureus]